MSQLDPTILVVVFIIFVAFTFMRNSGGASLTEHDPNSKVKMISSLREFDDMIKNNRLVIVDFFANWCGPCKMIAPRFEELANANPKAVFLKVNVDDVPAVARQQEIRAMPTFQVFKNGKKVDEIVGANIGGLTASIRANMSGL